MKACPQCSTEKPLEAFYADKSRASGRGRWCKACVLKHKREHPQKLTDRRRTTLRRYHQNLTPEQKARKIAARQEWVAANPDKHLAAIRKRLLRKTYGITVEEYDAMVMRQGRRCPICETAHSETRGKRLSVDHCHRTRVVRGLLCGRCNSTIGMARDNPEFLEAAAAYLRRSFAA